jgi:CHAP domain/Putative peptidoglycan binding domain
MATNYPGSPVGPGSTNEAAVRAIQTRLAELKIPESSGLKKIEIDGAFGPATESAVKLFQAQSVDPNGNPLEVDGFVGPMSWATLFGAKIATVKATGSPLLDAVIAKASAQVGVREQPLGSNRGPMVDKFIRASGLDPDRGSFAWCAAFLCWCFQEAAKDLGVTNPMPKTAGVLALWNKSGEKGLLRISRALASQQPQLVTPGMFFFLDTGGGTGHVGLVKSIQGVVLRTIEGNTTDKSGSREGIGVFERNVRTISSINLGFADMTRKF